MAMTKVDIIKQVEALGFTRKKATETVENLLGIIKSSLESGEDVLVSGFGKLCVKEKAPRRGRKPATGEDMVLEARRVVTFKPSGKLRDRVNAKSRN